MDKKKKVKPHKKRRIVDLYTILFMAALFGIFLISAYSTMMKTVPKSGGISYNNFLTAIDNGEVDRILHTPGENDVIVYMKDGRVLSTINPNYEEFRKDMLEKGVKIETRATKPIDALNQVLMLIPSLVIIGAFTIYIVKTLNVSSKQMFTVLDNGGNVTFKDVAGMENIKEEVEIAIETLVHIKELKTVGARPIKGILLSGAPGSGKTLVAKAIAGEAKVPFISCSGSDFVEMFVGVGAARIRSLWKLAKLNAPCVIFIDEIDALGRSRSSLHEESSRTLNMLLQRMDGIEDSSGILVVGATNLANEIDPALMRSGRFDKRIEVNGTKTLEDRKKIMQVHLRNKKVADDFDIDKAARALKGLSGADIENVLNDAVLISLSHDRFGVISFEDIDKAALKLRVHGVETNAPYLDIDKKTVAIHEAGHAIVAKVLGKHVDRVSVQGYTSGVGGLTQVDLDDEQIFRTKDMCEDDVKIMLGGLVAEQIINGASTQGPSNDLVRATEKVYNMIFRWGMTDSLITVAPDKLEEKEKKQIDDMLQSLKKQTEKIVKEHEKELLEIVDRLIEKDVIYDI